LVNRATSDSYRQSEGFSAVGGAGKKNLRVVWIARIIIATVATAAASAVFPTITLLRNAAKGGIAYKDRSSRDYFTAGRTVWISEIDSAGCRGGGAGGGRLNIYETTTPLKI
jgi:hypothetical protein